MACALFNHHADPAKAKAISAGTQPGAHVHPGVVAVMRELGIDLADVQPQKLTPELAQTATLLVTMVGTAGLLWAPSPVADTESSTTLRLPEPLCTHPSLCIAALPVPLRRLTWLL